MTHTGIVLAIIAGLVLLSAWASPRLFLILISLLCSLLGAVAAPTIAIWFWWVGYPLLALPALSILTLGGFLLLLKRRVIFFWAIATLYLVLTLPILEAAPVLLGVPGGVIAWFIARRLIECIRKRRTRSGQSNKSIQATPL